MKIGVEMDEIWMTTAVQELGEREVSGPGSNQRILEYWGSLAYPARLDSVPWCSAFVNWVMEVNGIRGTRAANARSWLHWGTPQRVPAYGAVTVLWRDDPKSWKGHVGFFLKRVNEHTVRILGGNQGDGVSVQDYPVERVIDYMWPANTKVEIPYLTFGRGYPDGE